MIQETDPSPQLDAAVACESERVTQVFSDYAMHVALGTLSGEAEILASMDRLKRAGAEGNGS